MGGQRPLGSSHRPTSRAKNGHWGDTEGPAHSYAAEEFMQRDGIACGGNGASSPDSLSREEEGECGGLLFLGHPYGGQVSGHPLDPLRARRPRLERIAEILGLAGHLPIEELHDAHGVGWPPVIG